jgi:hypothetical protein
MREHEQGLAIWFVLQLLAWPSSAGALGSKCTGAGASRLLGPRNRALRLFRWERDGEAPTVRPVWRGHGCSTTLGSGRGLMFGDGALRVLGSLDASARAGTDNDEERWT